jgi:GNAT superfamily N-acetyltransferase
MSAIRALEEASLAGLPALHTEHYDGWLRRQADGYSRRANSVAPLYPSQIDVEEKIRYCESAHARASLPCAFKVTAASTPEGLDAALVNRGHQRDAETLVCTWKIAGALSRPLRVEMFDAPEDPWLETWSQLSERPADDGIFPRLLAATPTAAVYVLIRHGDQGIGCARTTISAGVVGLYDLLVSPDHRRQGLATDLTLARLWWARSLGVDRAFLQVMARNIAAQSLQTGLGFRETYRYWYRLKP